MSKLINLKKAVATCSLLAVALGAASCGGSGTNNDQGTSFLGLGYFADAGGTTGVSELVIPIASDSPDQISLTVNGLPVDANSATAFLGVQNRLTSQFLRVTQIGCSYIIPGSSIPLIQDSSTFSFVLSPAGDAEELGQVETPGGNTGYLGFSIFSPDLIAYLNSIRNSLPILPFRMIITCDATAISQAGDVITTNDVSVTANVVEFAENAGFEPGNQIGEGGTATPQ